MLIELNMVMAAAALMLPDPTRPPDFLYAQPVVIPREVAEFEVIGIKYSESQRSAIVNGQVVSEGQPLGPAVVKRIDASQVVLDYEGEEVIVELVRRSVKQPVGRQVP